MISAHESAAPEGVCVIGCLATRDAGTFVTSTMSTRRRRRLEGAIITRQHAVLDALEIRFGEVADAIRRRIQAIQDEARLRALLKSAIQAGSIEEFTQTL